MPILNPLTKALGPIYNDRSKGVSGIPNPQHVSVIVRRNGAYIYNPKGFQQPECIATQCCVDCNSMTWGISISNWNYTITPGEPDTFVGVFTLTVTAQNALSTDADFSADPLAIAPPAVEYSGTEATLDAGTLAFAEQTATAGGPAITWTNEITISGEVGDDSEDEMILTVTIPAEYFGAAQCAPLTFTYPFTWPVD